MNKKRAAYIMIFILIGLTLSVFAQEGGSQAFRGSTSTNQGSVGSSGGFNTGNNGRIFLGLGQAGGLLQLKGFSSVESPLIRLENEGSNVGASVYVDDNILFISHNPAGVIPTSFVKMFPDKSISLENSNGNIFLNSDGNVGIDNLQPREKLDVGGGAIINGLTLGADGVGVDYSLEHETLGVTHPNMNLRLQSPNTIVFHSGGKERVIIAKNGTLIANGNLNVGGASNSVLSTRHVRGKNGNAVDNLYLNYNTGKKVVVGKQDNPSDLQVTGKITSQGKKVCLADGTDCKPSFELSSCNVKTAAFNAGFPTCDTGDKKMAQWCSGDCNGDDAKAVICCEEQTFCEALPREDFQTNRQCSAGKSLVAAWCSGRCESKDARVSICCEGPGKQIDAPRVVGRNVDLRDLKLHTVSGKCTVHPIKSGSLFQCTKPQVTLFSYKNHGGDAGVTVCCPPSAMLDLGLY